MSVIIMRSITHWFFRKKTFQSTKKKLKKICISSTPFPWHKFTLTELVHLRYISWASSELRHYSYKEYYLSHQKKFLRRNYQRTHRKLSFRNCERNFRQFCELNAFKKTEIFSNTKQLPACFKSSYRGDISQNYRCVFCCLREKVVCLWKVGQKSW